MRSLNDRVVSMSPEKLARHIDSRWRIMKGDQSKSNFIARLEEVDPGKVDLALGIIAEHSLNPESGFLAAAMWDQAHPRVC